MHNIFLSVILAFILQALFSLRLDGVVCQMSEIYIFIETLQFTRQKVANMLMQEVSYHNTTFYQSWSSRLNIEK